MGKADGQSDSFVEEPYASMAQTGPSQHIPDFAPSEALWPTKETIPDSSPS